MSYINPLHLPVANVQYSGYTTIGPAVSTVSAAPAPVHATDASSYRKRLPQPSYVPQSKWRSTTGRSNPLQPSIYFDYKGYQGQGVAMRDLSARSVPGLFDMVDGGEDKVLAMTSLKRITFRIMWPGYPQVDWARSIEINSDGPISRARLGQIVAQNFSRFIETHRSTMCTSPEFHIGPTGVRFDHLYLVALNNAFEDSWQADVIVDFR